MKLYYYKYITYVSPTSFNSAPAGLEDVSKYPELFSTLMASGMWTLDDLKKLAGLNFLRVFREVERVCLFIKDITRFLIKLFHTHISLYNTMFIITILGVSNAAGCVGTK